MAANTSLCTSCLRALRHQARKELRTPSLTSTRPAYRTLTTTPTTHQAPSNQQQQRFAKPTPPPTKSSRPAQSNDTTPLSTRLATQLRSTPTLRATTEPYIAYGSTASLFRACEAQCNYTIPSATSSTPAPAPKNAAGEDVGVGTGPWFSDLGLDVTFASWAQVMMLYMYILNVRLRGFPAEHVKVWQQNILDHFFYAAEDKMATLHGMSARGTRNKYLKDLWQQWRGILLSYDEGLIKGDAALGAAVWRNMFKADVEADVEKVGVVVAYLRRELVRVEGMEDAVVAGGEVGFTGGFEGARRAVGRESAWMRKAVDVEDLKVEEG